MSGHLSIKMPISKSIKFRNANFGVLSVAADLKEF